MQRIFFFFFLQYHLIIFMVSAKFVVISFVLLLMLIFCVFSIFFFVSLSGGLLILLNVFEEPALCSIDFFIVCLFLISLISALIIPSTCFGFILGFLFVQDPEVENQITNLRHFMFCNVCNQCFKFVSQHCFSSDSTPKLDNQQIFNGQL